MKKIAMVAVAASFALALSACGDAAEEAPAEEAVVEETVAPVEPIADDAAMAAEAATDEAAAAADTAEAAADEAAAEVTEEAPAE
jgi:hypothetical protein